MTKFQTGDQTLSDRIAVDLCKAYATLDGKLLLHNTRNCKRTLISKEAYANLIKCGEFRTLDEHVAHIIGLNPRLRERQADIRLALQTTLDQGMMLSAKEAIDSLKRIEVPPTVSKDKTRPVVVIMTWDRPEALERLLRSIARNCDTMKFHCLYVVDDSRSAENIDENQALVNSFKPQIEGVISYFGQAEQKSLLSGLIKQVPEHEDAIRFLADQSRWRDHWTSGLSRNLALLLSCGHHLIVLDDDIICNVYDPAQPKPDITFSDDPREAGFYSSQQDWASQHKALNIDPIMSHTQCLGMTFSEAVSVLGENHLGPAGLANATSLLVSELGPDSPVLVTECGTLGCPGTGNNTWLPDMASSSLKTMLESDEKTDNALNHRMVWSGRNQPHFSPRSNMSPITGLDNCRMLPPYFPAFRSEDKLFGYNLDFIFTSGVTLDYPWAVPHLPIPEREWCDQDRDFALNPSFPRFFFERILEKKSSCLADSPEDRLTALSALYRDLGATPLESQIALHRHAELRDASERLNHLSELLEAADSAPEAWRKYLQNGVSQLRADMDSFSQPDFRLTGLPPTFEGAALIEFWKEAWTGYAAALVAWPKIREAAKTFVGDQPC